jgi:hypothetical protein
MNIQPLVHLSGAIEAVLDAMVVPALIVLTAILVVATVVEIRARSRRRGTQTATTGPSATQRWNRARGAEA